MQIKKLGMTIFILVGMVTASFILADTKNTQASSISITLSPTDDAQISQHSPYSTNGFSNRIDIRNYFGGDGSSNWGSEGLVKFNLSSIPKNSTITSAILRLWYAGYADTNPQGRKLNLYAITSDWNESTVTWNTHPSYASQLTNYATVPWSTGVWMEWNVTVDVQSYIDGNISLYGWKVADEKYWGDVNIPTTHFSSKEGGHSPYLEIKYYPSPRPNFNWIDNSHQATDDAMINKRYPSSNSGFWDWIPIRNAFGGDGSSNWAYEGLVKFNLSDIPKNSIITSATLRLWYAGYTDNNPYNRKLNLYAITSDWNESTVTWNTHPSYASQLTNYATVPWSTGVWMEWNVTVDVQSYIDGNIPLYGWKVADEKYWGTSNIPIAYFSSKEGSHAPYLEIEYKASSPGMVYVDNDFNSSTPGWQYDHFNVIQDGIDAVAENGTVYVFNGTYYENVVVNKTINLIGEDRNGTVIDGSGSGDVVYVSADLVSISMFTIANGSFGIRVADYTEFNKIKNNIIKDNINEAITLTKVKGYIINNNIFKSNRLGLWLWKSTNCHVANNEFFNNTGITLYGNLIQWNSHNITNNTADGKPIVYYKNKSLISVPSSISQVILANCSEFVIMNIVSDNHFSIQLGHSNNNTILHNTLSYGYDLISLYSSNSNIIYENTIRQRDNNGIFMRDSSKNSLFRNNIGGEYPRNSIGIYLMHSNNNLIYGNNITSHFIGLKVAFGSNNNLIYHNNFINNRNENAESGETNQWDNGYPSGGNYWSDFDEPSEGAYDNNSDGIVDSPYNIPGGSNQDRYPLMHPYGSNKLPVANFTWSPLNPTDMDTIQFTDLSSDSDGSIVNWTWNFGDGATSYQQNPSHQYPNNGTYIVNLTVTDDDGATDTIQKSIAVSNIPPTADFSYAPSNPSTADTIQFTDSSSDSDGSIVSWSWEFGDGYTSTLQNPAHQYVDDGTYLVNLTVTDDDGATDTIQKSIIVSNVPPTADFSYHFKDKQTIAFTDTSTDSDGYVVNWTWTFGDSGISYEQNPSHKYADDGMYNITLTITDDDGATDSTSKSIYIDTYPPWTDIWVNGTIGENDWYVSDYVVIAFLAHDNGSGVDRTMYRLDGGDWQVYKDAMGIWKNGKHTIEYYSVDNAGNIESIKSYSLKIDNKSPEIKVLYPNGGETINGTVTIEWSAIDNCDSNLLVSIRYSNDAGLTWDTIAADESNDGAYEWNTAGLPDGTDYLIKISTSDDAGNVGSDISDETFTIHNNIAPPSVSIVKPRGHLYIDDREIMPLPGNTTIIWGAITIEATAESVRGIEKVEFYIDDELKATLTEEPYQWAWDEPAFFTHTIKVIAYDNVGNTATDEQTVWIFNP